MTPRRRQRNAPTESSSPPRDSREPSGPTASATTEKNETPSDWGGGQEWRGLLVIAGISLVLRLGVSHELAVEHFDEGVYASNLFFDAATGFRYPDQHLYAPPLLPSTIEWLFVFLGPGHLAAMLPSLLAGCLTPLIIWWLGRRWFGPDAGLWAAGFAACSDVHGLFSRTALTDTLLTFCLLLAVCALTEGFLRVSVGWGIVAGIFTALGWWTKYNGWLPLAICGAALGCLLVMGRCGWRTTLSRGRVLCVMIVVAAGLWSPWLWSLQSEGGYAAVAANHRLYVVGLAGWLNSFFQQAQNQRLIEGGPSALAPLVGWLAIIATGRKSLPRAGTQLMLAGMLGVSFILVGTHAALTLLATGVVIARLSSLSKKSGDDASDNEKLASCFLVVWFVGLLLATPLYRPYARLMLPWLAACWLAAGAGLQRISDNVDTRGFGKGVWVWGVSIPCVIGVLIFAAMQSPFVPAWESRRGLALATDQVLRRVVEESKAVGAPEGAFVIYVYAEPATLFELRLAGAELVGPVASLSLVESAAGPQAPTFLVTGPHAERDPQFASEFARVGSKLKRLATEKYLPSLVVRLDELSTPNNTEEDVEHSQELKLYRVR